MSVHVESPIIAQSPWHVTIRKLDTTRHELRFLTSRSVLGRLGRPYRHNCVLDQTTTVSIRSANTNRNKRTLTSTPVPQPLISRAQIIQTWF
jgi:hypothetical protein